MTREKKRLTAKQFELLRPRYQVGEENVIGLLLDHIDVAEVELAKLQALADTGGFNVVFRLAQAEEANRKLTAFVESLQGESERGDVFEEEWWGVVESIGQKARALLAELNQ